MLIARGVGFDIGARTLLDGVDFALAPGEVVALLGPNGSGKSTLVKCLAGLNRLTRGECYLNDRAVTGVAARELARLRAVLTQETSVFGDHLCGAIVELGRLAVAEAPGCTRQLVADAMALTGTAHLRERRYHTCSGGERQRVQLARVLAQLMPLEDGGEARFLMLDEPVSALDPAYQIGVLDLVARLSLSGLGVLVVLHDLNLAARFADRIVLLKEGAVAAAGTPREVLIPDTLQDVYDIGFRLAAIQDDGSPLVMPVDARSDPVGAMRARAD